MGDAERRSSHRRRCALACIFTPVVVALTLFLLRGREEIPVLHDDSLVFDRFAQGIIRRKVWLLVGRAGFTPQDRQDLEQELLLRLLQSLDHFDPAKGHLHAFLTTVIERAVAMILRERLAKKRDDRSVRSLDQVREKAGDSTAPADPHHGWQEPIDLAMDLAEELARLPEDLHDLRPLAELLLTGQSLAQAARDLGTPRSTLQRQVQRLRRYFEDTGLRIYL